MMLKMYPEPGHSARLLFPSGLTFAVPAEGRQLPFAAGMQQSSLVWSEGPCCRFARAEYRVVRG